MIDGGSLDNRVTRQTPLKPSGRVAIMSWIFEIAGLIIVVVYAGWWLAVALVLIGTGHNLSYHYRQKRDDQEKESW